ncbi:MAG: hypothetical protein M3357_20220 [Actinomycetota bacterium]|jgi:hypothetical protein|nr:hypothetical protein [Actinomycetota bacterium]
MAERHDPEAPLYSGEPLETEEGTRVPRQQAAGQDAVEGGGEFPDPSTPPQLPAPGAAEDEDGSAGGTDDHREPYAYPPPAPPPR